MNTKLMMKGLLVRILNTNIKFRGFKGVEVLDLSEDQKTAVVSIDTIKHIGHIRMPVEVLLRDDSNVIKN